ncbi:porin family protein [Lacibacter sp.]|uniref:porin family protein n=1 Tax=Lacibacter sp. TaxID=1915409 RepID=UPI002B4B198E|nr:porin family protein [Lacibacter sp.]HLP38771.1 porin family protein [Lacibacter sp.]
MKQLITVILLLISGAAIAQSTSQKKITQKKDTLRASGDYFMKFDDINGESPDTLPPAPNLLTLSVGGSMSQTTNTNLADRYTAQARPGYAFSIGYARELPQSRLQINASYFKGGVNVAAGDINGDGKDDISNVDLQYLTIPVQYQFYLGARKRFFVGGGGYASFLLSSKQTGRPIYGDIKTYDAGATASAGAWLGKRLMLQTGYQFGLVDIDVSESNKARNGMAFLMLSYALFSKIKYGPVITIKPKG